MGKGAECETTDQKSDAAGLLNFDTALWDPPYFGRFVPNSVIFRTPDAPFPTTEWERGGIRNYRPNRGAPRNTTERQGTIRNLTERPYLDIPHWAPPNFGGLLPNSLIFFAPNAPFSQRLNGEGVGIRKYRPKSDAAEEHGALWNS